MNTSGTGAVIGTMVLAVALSAIPAAASAQASSVNPWLPFMGCWIEVEAPEAGAPVTCLVPAKGGAEILTATAEEVLERRLLVADGEERPVDASGCRGVEASETSSDGLRIYTRSTLSCEGGIERTTRGIVAMVSPDEWIDVRALAVGDGSVSWVKRYRAAPESRVNAAALTDAERAGLERVMHSRDMAMETARMAASSTPSVEQVIDAHAHTDAEAVRAWIAEQNAPMRLDADRLLRLADAGVSSEVIDVLVAVSHPERFATGREPDVAMGQQRRGYDSYIPLMFDPFYYDPYYYRGQYYRYGLGYNSWSRPYGGGPGVIVVQPVSPRPDAHPGRLVKGKGYTRGGDAASAPRAVPRGSGGSGNAARATAPASSSSSGAKAKAKPKPKGGG